MIWQRIKNLWKLSAYEPSRNLELLEGEVLVKTVTPIKRAQIIKRHNDPAGEIVNSK